MLKDMGLGISFLQKKWVCAPRSGWNAKTGFHTRAQQTSTARRISSVALLPVEESAWTPMKVLASGGRLGALEGSHSLLCPALAKQSSQMAGPHASAYASLIL